MIYNWQDELRILTLWQPWASLMAWGEKVVETRPGTINWHKFRGWVAIHASHNAAAAKTADVANESYLTRALKAQGITDERGYAAPWQLPLGKILCLLKFTAYSRTENVDISDQERSFGDYRPGRIAIHTHSLTPLPDPISWKGSQGLPRAPLDLRQKIAAQLTETKNAER